MIIQPQDDTAASFNSGLAAVQIPGKWGFIEKDGSTALASTWERTGEFSEGLCPVKNGGLWVKRLLLFRHRCGLRGHV
jgi:hypothetical protein